MMAVLSGSLDDLSSESFINVEQGEFLIDNYKLLLNVCYWLCLEFVFELQPINLLGFDVVDSVLRFQLCFKPCLDLLESLLYGPVVGSMLDPRFLH